MMKRLRLLAIAGAALACPGTVAAQEMSIPVDFQVSLFSRLLHFDRALGPPESELTLALVFQGGLRESTQARDEFIAAVDAASGQAVGHRFHVVAIDLGSDDSAEALDRAIPSGVDLMYVAPLRAFSIDALAQFSRSRSIRTLTGVPDYVHRGLSVGLELEAGSSRILVNRTAAQLEGADFSSELLKLARIVGE